MERTGQAPEVGDLETEWVAAEAGKDAGEQSQVAKVKRHQLRPGLNGAAFGVEELCKNFCQQENGKAEADYAGSDLFVVALTPPGKRQRNQECSRNGYEVSGSPSCKLRHRYIQKMELKGVERNLK